MRLVFYSFLGVLVFAVLGLSQPAFTEEGLMQVKVQVNYPDGEEKAFLHILKINEKKPVAVGSLPTSCSAKRTSLKGFFLECRDSKSSMIYGSAGLCGESSRMAMLTLLKSKTSSAVTITATCSL